MIVEWVTENVGTKVKLKLIPQNAEEKVLVNLLSNCEVSYDVKSDDTGEFLFAH